MFHEMADPNHAQLRPFHSGTRLRKKWNDFGSKSNDRNTSPVPLAVPKWNDSGTIKIGFFSVKRLNAKLGDAIPHMYMKVLLIALFCVVAASTGIAEVKLPDVLSNSMVLQQKQSIPIWGTAEPGESVTVTFAGKKKTAVAGSDGRWRVDLGKFDASAEPRSMTIAGKNSIELKDILVGEVWLVSGQSNMQSRLDQSTGGESAVAVASDPALRLFNVSREVAFKRQTGPLARWLPTTPETVKDFSGAGYFFALELQAALKVPVGIINSSYGGSQAEAWTPVDYLNASPDLKPTVDRTITWNAEREKVRADYAEAIRKWREDSDKARAAGARPSPSPGVPDALRDYRIASSIYDGMIEPLMPFAIRGAVWYQGESNEGRAEQYGILLPVMIRSWRERWGLATLPFGIIQLPNYRRQNPEPEDSAWSHVREYQRRSAMADKNNGLIVTIDIGEANDIHPKNKLDVGKRMAIWALRNVYGRRLTEAPTLTSYRIEGNKIVLTFKDVGTGLKIKSGDKLNEFVIAGADQKWHWAEAKIIGKNRVEVWSSAVPGPQAVRYAFNANPKDPNLTNDSGLPASPFRTDNWPDPTAGKR
jgi:sialate O-acetylesterase